MRVGKVRRKCLRTGPYVIKVIRTFQEGTRRKLNGDRETSRLLEPIGKGSAFRMFQRLKLREGGEKEFQEILSEYRSKFEFLYVRLKETVEKDLGANVASEVLEKGISLLVGYKSTII